MLMDKKKVIIPAILLVFIILLIIGAGVIHFTFGDKEFERNWGDEERPFRAKVWRDYFLEGAFMALIMLVLARKISSPILPAVIGIITWCLHYLGGITDWYHLLEWWDHMTHGLSHVCFVLFLAYGYQLGERKGWFKIPPWVAMLLIMVLSTGLGAMFELREYAFSIFFDTIDQGGYDNTMLDIAWNFIGASLGMFYYVLTNSSFGGPKTDESGSKKLYRWKEAQPLIYLLIALAVIDFFLLISWVEKVEKYDQLWAECIRTLIATARLLFR